MDEFHVMITNTKTDQNYSYYVYTNTVSEAALKALELFHLEFGYTVDFQVIVISRSRFE